MKSHRSRPVSDPGDVTIESMQPLRDTRRDRLHGAFHPARLRALLGEALAREPARRKPLDDLSGLSQRGALQRLENTTFNLRVDARPARLRRLALRAARPAAAAALPCAPRRRALRAIASSRSTSTAASAAVAVFRSDPRAFLCEA
jgi:hypothetical protein